MKYRIMYKDDASRALHLIYLSAWASKADKLMQYCGMLRALSSRSIGTFQPDIIIKDLDVCKTDDYFRLMNFTSFVSLIPYYEDNSMMMIS